MDKVKKNGNLFDRLEAKLEERENRPKRKNRRDKFLEEYVGVPVPADNKDGFKIDYIYYAVWYKWDLQESELKHKKNTIMLGFISSLIVYVLTALNKADLNSLILVALPAVGMLCTMVFEAFGVCQFFFAKYRTTKSNYLTAERRIKACTLLNSALAVFASFACVYYCISIGFTSARIMVAVGYFAEGILSILINRYYTKIPFTTENNDAIDRIDPSWVGGKPPYSKKKHP